MEVLKVVQEHLAKLGERGIEVGLVLPLLLWQQGVTGHSRAAVRDLAVREQHKQELTSQGIFTND